MHKNVLTMKKILFLLLLILADTTVMIGKRLENDSLLAEIHRIDDNTKKYEALYNLALMYSDSNVEDALDCAYEANKVAVKMNDYYKQAESNIIMGDIFKKTKAFLTAISYYESAIDYFKLLNNYEKINLLYLELAELYDESEFDFEWSLEALNKALRYANKVDINKTYVKTYRAFGDFYLKNDADSLALHYYDMVLDYPLNGCTITDIANVLYSKGKILVKEREYEDAMATLDSSLYLSIRSFDDKLQIMNYSLKGDIYDSLHQVETAEEYYMKAVDISFSTRDFDNCAANIFKLGLIKKQQDDYGEAIEVFTMLSDSSRAYKRYQECSQSYFQLSECYEKLRQYTEAYNYHILYDIYRDSANYVKNKSNIEELRNKYILSLNISELNAKDMELQNLRQKRYNYIFTILTCFFIMILLISFIILYSHNKMLKHKNVEAEYLQTIKLEKIEKNIIEMQLKSNKKLLVNFAFYLKSYMEYISPIKNELKDAIDLPYAEIKNKVRGICLSLQNNISLFAKMDELNAQIDEIYNDFLSKIEEKHPNLTKAEKRLCAMLYIDMSSKEIAMITNTTVRSVETSRYRLRKKFNIEKDEDIVFFLRNL